MTVQPVSDPTPPTRPDARGGKRGVQRVFVVDWTERLSPHLVRVHLGGPAFADFVAAADPDRLAATDTYVKLLLARPEAGLTPPYDLDALRAELPPVHVPVRRTYTVRAVDQEAQTIAIDFVVHGDEGIAGPWADRARPGDLLALSGPGGTYLPADDGSEQILLGDDSAIPAIAATLEAMPADRRGLALLEVDGPADELTLEKPAGVELRWIHRSTGGTLIEEVRALARPVGLVQVFAHGERSAMKTIRGIVQDDWGLDRSALSLSAYWALGRAEDTFQAEKREPVGKIFAD